MGEVLGMVRGTLGFSPVMKSTGSGIQAGVKFKPSLPSSQLYYFEQVI